MRNVKRLLQTVGRYKNWIEIVRAMVRKRRVGRVEMRSGVCIYSSGDNTLLEMTEEICFRKVYNPKGFEIGVSDVVVDIGANVGVFSIFVAMRTKNTVYAYEPYLRNFEVLKENTEGLKNIKCFCEAVSGGVGKKKLFLDGDYTVGILFDRNIHGKLKKNVLVKTTTLKNIFIDNKLKKIDFLKIDAEGSEGEILKSTPVKYLKQIDRISLEFHDNVSSLKHGEIIKLLNKAGFITRLNWQKGSLFGYIYGKREP